MLTDIDHLIGNGKTKRMYKVVLDDLFGEFDQTVINQTKAFAIDQKISLKLLIYYSDR